MGDNLDKQAVIPLDKSSWFSWIPTNIGYLNFNYIADEKSLISVFGENNFILKINPNNEKVVHLLNTNLSDLNNTVKSLLSKEEIPSTAEIKFSNNTNFNTSINRLQPSNITGYCNLFYKDEQNKLLMEVKTDFDIETNGKIEIKNIFVNYSNDVEDIDLNDNTTINTIINAVYTLIKKISHGDNHHFQKIDTMIGVYTKFVPEQILTDLGFQIKRIDKFVKSNENTTFTILYQQDKSSADIIAEGFMSYISTFYELFIQNDSCTNKPVFKKANNSLNGNINYIKYKNIINTVKSIKAGVQKHKQAIERKKNKYAFLVSLFALIAAYNILFSNIIEHKSENYSTFSTWVISNIDRDSVLILISLIVFSFVLKDFLANYAINLFRKAMSNPSRYTFIEILILYKYIKSHNTKDEIFEITENKTNIKIIEDYINDYLNLILYIAILGFISLILSFSGFDFYSLIPIVFYLLYLIYNLIKFRKIHNTK